MNSIKHHHIHLETQEQTEVFASQLSLFLQPGIVLLLKGDLGAGKSTFARALIRTLARDSKKFEIPSPSYALVQTYDTTRFPVTHIDLYRTKSDAEVPELGLSDLASHHLLIIEWPRPSTEILGRGQMVLEFSGTGTARDVEITASGSCEGLPTRFVAVKDFLARQGWDKAERFYLDGDASARRYERLKLNGSHAILMDMPNRPDGPPVKNGKAYSAIAHLAEGIRSVIAVNDVLIERGYGAPQTLACDPQRGLALIEDLGDEVFGRLRAANVPMAEPMQAAVEVLAHMAAQAWPQQVKMRDGSIYQMSAYDEEAQLIEVDLLTSWFFPHVQSVQPDQAQVTSFHRIWRDLLSVTRIPHPVWTLRDFHSPNLIWQPQKDGLQKVGLIDTQDALLGHPAYDLVSLLQDARIDIPPHEQRSLYEYYSKLRTAAGNFDAEEFAAAFAVLGAQRATKILGIFARLAKRDGKLVYLKHLPRVSRYLSHNLAHPILHELRDWYKTNLPQAIEAQH